ncbi:hypothetical protein T11_6311 [Trichinella zimbabwensis]|uniref:Lipoprotein n=1 Tax=Trichinella zimbabwensis TaxID=268475 RepID=A0A0V1I8V6_9BILA|nr:hypothetical protein T11_6311 [Trichinella zimbabwensis]
MKTNVLLFITGCFIAQSCSAFLIRFIYDGKAVTFFQLDAFQKLLTEGNYNVVMDFGNILPLTQAKGVSRLFLNETFNTLYSSIMTGINAPNEYELVEKEYMLWFVLGITGSEENKEKAVALMLSYFVSKAKVFRPHVYLIYENDKLLLFCVHMESFLFDVWKKLFTKIR